jgi:hypothetical protein
LTLLEHVALLWAMRPLLLTIVTALGCLTSSFGAGEAKVLPKANALPLALNDDFEFRKTKLFHLTPAPPPGVQDAAIRFERDYRLFGAVTGLDQRQRFGHYFDFFWRAKRNANVTVRLEYRQEKLRGFVQAREVNYANVRGNEKTEFAIVGDDYFDDGRVIAWRCLLIENGRIVGLTRSYLWE